MFIVLLLFEHFFLSSKLTLFAMDVFSHLVKPDIPVAQMSLL